MKLFRHIALSTLIAVGAFTAVTYTACTKDACSGVTCYNGGICMSGSCSCPTGYEGTHCDSESRAKFIKTWSASETTDGGASLVYSATIAANTTSSDVTKVIIGKSFADNFFTTNNIDAVVNGNTITIPSQAPDNNAYLVAGTGTYSNGKISWTYTITNTGVTPNQVLSVTGTWQ